MPRLVRRYIDLCADISVRRRKLLGQVQGCKYADFFFGHLQLSAGSVYVTVNNVTAGALANVLLCEVRKRQSHWHRADNVLARLFWAMRPCITFSAD